MYKKYFIFILRERLFNMIKFKYLLFKAVSSIIVQQVELGKIN